MNSFEKLNPKCPGVGSKIHPGGSEQGVVEARFLSAEGNRARPQDQWSERYSGVPIIGISFSHATWASPAVVERVIAFDEDARPGLNSRWPKTKPPIELIDPQTSEALQTTACGNECIGVGPGKECPVLMSLVEIQWPETPKV